MKISAREFLLEGIKLYAEGKITKERFIEGLKFLNSSTYNHNELQELYTILNIPKLINDVQYKSNKYTQTFDYSTIKYDYIPEKIEYYPPKSNDWTPDEGDTVQGVDYIKASNPGRNYAHMRRMLQKLWDMTNTHAMNRFDIDFESKLDPNQLAGYIRAYSDIQIDDAHYAVRTEYKGRGRPKGARGRDKIFGKRDSSDGAQSSDGMSKDLPELEGTNFDKIIFDEATELPNLEDKPEQVTTNVDLSKYVKWVDFSDRVAPIERNVEAICKDLINIQAWGHNTDKRIEALERAAPTVIEIKPSPELPTIEMGIQHYQFPKLLRMVQAKLPSGFPVIPWVYGPAGTGKTTACENVARALQLDFYTMGTTLAKFEILGFVNTTGYQTTPFRKAYEQGGVFCADEMDSWAKEATVAINGALANGHCNFADKTVTRHPNFVFIAAANTVGQGATMDYVGRNKQDAATLDRVNYLSWPLDEALEDSLCPNKDWLNYVRHVRHKANNSGINPKPLITPRASMSGAALLNAGLELTDVIDMCLRKGLSDAQWNQIK